MEMTGKSGVNSKYGLRIVMVSLWSTFGLRIVSKYPKSMIWT